MAELDRPQLQLELDLIAHRLDAARALCALLQTGEPLTSKRPERYMQTIQLGHTALSQLTVLLVHQWLGGTPSATEDQR